jgi:tyrosyl-tRNA synthetase
MTQSLAEILRARGLVFQHSGEALEEITDREPRTLYLGFDPSADSLHVGHLAPYMIVRHFIRHKHQAILLVGGGTGMIGDPSFKGAERQLLDDVTVTANARAIAAQVGIIVGTENIPIVNNADWLGPLSVIDFLRDTGKHFTVNAMLQKEMVRERINDPDKSISFTEFAYPLLQSYDFWHLHTTHGCTLQIGGSDQWGNITWGIDYIRRTTGAIVHGITAPLILDGAGRKFGKSEGNAIWLDPAKTSPYRFFQFWMGASDESLPQYLRIFTDMEISDIDTLIASHQKAPHQRVAQRALALSVTTLIHGETEAARAMRVSDILFGGEVSGLLPEDVALVRAVSPTVQCTTYELTQGVPLIDMLVRAEVASSKRDARELVQGGAIALNGQKITDGVAVIDLSFFANGIAFLSRGKREITVLSKVEDGAPHTGSQMA